MAEADLNVLKKKRTQLRTAVTKLITAIESELNKTDFNCDMLEENIELLNDKFEHLNLTDSAIENLLKPEDIEREFQSSEEYREKVIVCKFRTSKRIKAYVSMNATDTIIQNSEHNNSKSDVNIKENMNIRLPKLSIPKFSGDIDQWLSFWNSFELAVHKNESLDDVDKFNYLKAHLTGNALSTIEGFSLTKANYESAIKLLEERFGKSDLLINAHMTSLLSIPPLRSSNDLKAFRKLFDHCQIQIRSLETLGVTSETYGKLLCPMLLKLLPSDLVLEFNKQKSNLDVNTLMNFLSGELQSRERTETHRLGAVVPFTRQTKSNDSSINNAAKGVKFATAAEFMNKSKSVKPQNVCIFCDKSHPSADCRLALRFPHEKRKQILTSKGACFKCLKPKHLARFCRTKVSCTACNGQHLFIMCDSAKSLSPDNNNKNVDDQEQAENKECCLTNNVNLPQVFLQTLVVRIRGKNNEKLIRGLVDTGSQRSYLSKYAATLMNYDNIGEEKICHSLFGGSEFLEEHKKYLVHLSSFNNKYHCNFEVFDQKTICSDISRIDISPFTNELKKRKIFLTDTVHVNQDLIYENSPSEVHLLIGADIVGKLLTGRTEKLPSGLVCIETLLGWTVIGKTDKINAEDRNNLALSLHVNNHCISHLWKLDTLGILDPGEAQSKREIEDASKEHFVRTVKRDSDGRYIVSLPWIEGHQTLPNNKNVAEQRLKSVVKTLKNKDLIEAYENVFKQWLDEQIIEEVKPCELEKTNCHYLPHRAVIKDRSTTKIRPVFDASAKDKNGISLNDCLTKGPNYIELIPSILNKFRLYEYGVIADIRKAFLQIGIRDEDRDFLRFLWWEGGDPNDKKIFRHRRVVFGVNSSPFLLGAVLNYHLDSVPDYLQETASKLKGSMYVDNCVTSCKSKDELLNFIRQSKEIMHLACFDLRGWLYNGIQLETSEICTEDEKIVDVSEEILRDGIVPVLGLNWDISADVLLCNTNPNEYNDGNLTKRVILSLASQLFDPIGFLCPVTLIPKVLMQECWRRKLSWDVKLPTDLEKKFLKWKGELKFVENVRIPRKMLNNSESETDLSLHVFCDASQHAYATCIFLREESVSDVKCHLVQARARVSPLKSVSVPRLELLACLIGVRLMSSIKKDFPFDRIPVFYWTDSMNALYWIRKQECWTVFVMNRVNEIRSMSNPESWNFVPGTMNPADLPSRGCNAKDLARTKWWEGPQWLKNSIEDWPKSEILPNLDIIEGEKRKSVVSSTNTDSFSKKFYDNFSSYEKIVTVIAWIYRFYQNCKLKKENRILDNLSVSERNQAEFTLIKNIQSEVFSGHEDKCLRNLQAFTDNYGIIRIRTRILRREDEENFRFPIVLPSKHPLVEKLIRHEHEKMSHAGVQFLISTLREKFWILKARKTIRQVVRKCVRCLRYDGKFKKSPIAPIIEDRVRDATIFEIVGIDLAGPLILKHNQKTWIVVFTCAIFRAVHLELCASLSTESFLQTLRRFIARRGRPHVIYSDNGTNFLGTSNLFKTINWEKVSKEATINKIQWKFIPPAAPWWGGWWERLIGILKRILRKVLGRTSLNYDELSTILCECESIMNNRPLTYMSDDVEDLTPLTPSMFLHEIRETGVPDFDQLDTSSLNRRLIYRQKLKQNLLVRFRSEYLGQLRQNYQHIKEDKPVEVGDLVLISSDNLKRLDWPLGRILETFRSKDGHVRLAKVRTSGGEILRPVARLVPLEINSTEEDIRPQPNVTLKPPDSQPDVPIVDDNVPVQDVPIVTTRHGRTVRPVQRFAF